VSVTDSAARSRLSRSSPSHSARLQDQLDGARHSRLNAQARLTAAQDRCRLLQARADANVDSAWSIIAESRLLLDESKYLYKTGGLPKQDRSFGPLPR
jgi:hypothetical protein